MTTLVSDDFNRANQNPISSSGNWKEANYPPPGQLISNGYAGVNLGDPPSDCNYYDDGSTSLPRDGWAEIVVRSAATCTVGVKIRGDNNGSGYEYIVNSGNVNRLDATATRTNLATRLSGTIADGDTFRIEAVGASPTTIKIYRKPAGGSYAQVGADVVDSTSPITTAGFSSVVSGGPTHIIESWAAGDQTGEPPGGGGGDGITLAWIGA